MTEWLMVADCKSALFGVRGFKSLSHNTTKRKKMGLNPSTPYRV